MKRFLALLMMVTVAGCEPGKPEAPPAPVAWVPCPAYSAEVLAFRGIEPEVWARVECGTLKVPLDYDDPEGDWLTMALTRLRATDSARRRGILAFNPGGPGGAGFLMPAEIVSKSAARTLAEDFDLIGFDPRGVGQSTKVECSLPPMRSVPGNLTEEKARALFEAGRAANEACGRAHTAFLQHLTTADVARDLDALRRSLREDRLSFFGVSWGTALGAVYRSMFPSRVRRMWLDSPALLHFRADTFDGLRVAATARMVTRFAEWVAQRHNEYGFGGTASEVERAWEELSRREGPAVAGLASAESAAWPEAATTLRRLRGREGAAPSPAPEPKEPQGMPERFNPTMQRAVFCNQDTGRAGFGQAWADYQERLRRHPLAAATAPFHAGCAGWPLPAQQIPLQRNDTPLMLSGHRHESQSPYEWTPQMRDAIGGTIETIDDDVHGSVPMNERSALRMAEWFRE